jgi:hypothetical protein
MFFNYEKVALLSSNLEKVALRSKKVGNHWPILTEQWEDETARERTGQRPS